MKVSKEAREAAKAWIVQAQKDGLIGRGNAADIPTAQAFARFEAETMERAAKIAESFVPYFKPPMKSAIATALRTAKDDQ